MRVFMLTGSALAFSLLLSTSDCKGLRPQAGREAEYGAIVHRVERLHPDVLFLGDSITAALLRHDHRAVFQRHYGDLNAAIAAIPGNTSANTLWLLDHLPKMSPKVIVLQIGANDQRCRWGPEITAQNIRAIISRAKQKWPMARIVLVPPA